MGLECDVARTRTNHIRLMRDTLAVLDYMLDDVSQATATTRRDPNDGDKGWTVAEVVCHLRDFDRIFLDRVQRIVAEDEPKLLGYDHEQLAVDGRYNEQDLRTTLRDLQQSRAEFVTCFQALSEAQWARAGIHAERGRFTLDDALMQVGLHDALHLEQITRILRG
ncbi:DinB family protein [Caldilinea sp.]|uniref:DinB family protein n=1 Tax=Caldilinea sp. TaxID=2293560 RepID=UPI002C536AB4|nr:DinB family protein [Anaerolineales bacterium]HQY95002.1 DinB family protein [Caldilinea sp.]HRA65369.1 DinB family protein [Caldilinea sp.]